MSVKINYDDTSWDAIEKIVIELNKVIADRGFSVSIDRDAEDHDGFDVYEVVVKEREML